MIYDDLVSDVQDWLVGHDVGSRINGMISMAETRINDDVRVRAMTKRIVLNGVDTRYIPLPARFSDLRRLQWGGDTIRRLIQVSPEAMSLRQKPEPALSNVNAPSFYALVGDEIEFDVIIGATAEVEITYWENFPPLTPTAPDNTNWLMQNGYGVYLYGVLMEAAPYIRDSDQLQVFAAAYTAHVDTLNEQYRKSLAGGAPRVMVENSSVLP